MQAKSSSTEDAPKEGAFFSSSFREGGVGGKRFGIFVGYALLPWLQYWRLWFGLESEKSYLSGYVFEVHWPRFQAAVTSFYRGEWAQWDPFLAGGWPLSADPALGLYNPAMWPYLLYYGVTRSHHYGAFQGLVMLQLTLVGVGMYLYLRALALDRRAAWVGGSILMMSGAYPWLSTSPILGAVVWLPWSLWSLERLLRDPRLLWAAWLGFFVGCAFLGGSLPGAFLVVVALLVKGFLRLLWEGCPRPKPLPLLLLLAVLWAVGFSAPMWLPYLAFKGELARMPFVTKSLVWRDINGLLTPVHHVALYHGVLLLPLLLASWFAGLYRRVVWGALTLVLWGICLSVWPSLQKLDPSALWFYAEPASLARGDRYLVWSSVGFAIFAALGVDALLSVQANRWRGRCFAILWGLWGVWILAMFGYALWNLEKRSFAIYQEVVFFQQWVLCGGLLFALGKMRQRGSWGWVVLFLFLAWIDTATYHRREALRGYGEFSARDGAMLSRLPNGVKQPTRILNQHDHAPRLASLLFHLRSLDAPPEGMQSRRYQAFAELMKQHPQLLARFGVSEIISPKGGNLHYHHPRTVNRAEPHLFEKIDESLHALRYRSKLPVMPRIQWVPRWKIAANRRDAQSLLLHLDPLCEILLERPLSFDEKAVRREDGCPKAPKAGILQNSRWNGLEAKIDAPTEGLVLIQESYAAGWRATLNGQPIALMRANLLMQAIWVPKGVHTLKLRYRSEPLRWGYLLGALAWLAFLGVFFGAWRQRKSDTTKAYS